MGVMVGVMVRVMAGVMVGVGDCGGRAVKVK